MNQYNRQADEARTNPYAAPRHVSVADEDVATR